MNVKVLDDAVIKIMSRIAFIILFLAIWQYMFEAGIWSPILFPSAGMVGKALIKAFSEREFGAMVFHSLYILVKGLLLGVTAALILSGLSIINKVVYYIFNMIVSTFDLIPGIALIPIAILWLGIGDGAIIFMVFHSVIWPMSRNLIDGFNAVPRLYLEVGENIGLSKLGLVKGVFIPAALPRIFSGVKVGWARAWRGLISAEMVFGGGSALGIGYFIAERRTNLDTAGIFAAIIVIIAIGIIVEYGVFRAFENHTFRKWGMTR